MAEQMILIEPDEDHFRLDEYTREIGRRGVAEVRRILAQKAREAEEREESKEHPAAA
jgi:hypothetical protein